MVKILTRTLLMLLGLLLILSAFFYPNTALTQSSQRNQVDVVATTEIPGTSAVAEKQSLEKKVIGLRLHDGSWSDPYNNALWQGVANALQDTLSSQATFDVVLYDDASPLSNDVDLVFTAGAELVEQLGNDATDHPDTYFVALDSVAPPTTVPNFYHIDFQEYEVSYLMGYLAGTLSQTGQVGFVGDTKTATRLANQAAFSQGLTAACTTCQLHSIFLGSDSDINLAETAAQSIQQKGADIIFTDAGELGHGVINYINTTMCASIVKTRLSPLTSALTLVAKDINYLSRCAGSYPLFFMSTGRFQPVFGDTDNDPSSLNHGLTSLATHVDLAVYKVIQTFIAGDTLSNKLLTLKDDAVGIAIDDYNRALLPAEVLVQLETIKSQIISGDIVVDKVLKE